MLDHQLIECMQKSYYTTYKLKDFNNILLVTYDVIKADTLATALCNKIKHIIPADKFLVIKFFSKRYQDSKLFGLDIASAEFCPDWSAHNMELDSNQAYLLNLSYTILIKTDSLETALLLKTLLPCEDAVKTITLYSKQEVV